MRLSSAIACDSWPIPASMRSARERLGVQPVVTLTVNGAIRSEVTVGQAVTFTGTITVPPGAGSVIAAQWDSDMNSPYARISNLGRVRIVVK